MSSNLVNSALFFLFIFLSGFWLSRTGKPYSIFISTIHKLIGVATGVFLGITVNRIYMKAPINSGGIISIVTTVIFFVALVATGGLLSAEKPMPGAVSTIHKLFPYLAVLSTGV
ncbi:MAG: hypothetical protein MUO76_13235, partial [Anaerolineaceae bacterium]|nr:hypothetical protein [Anaerolineaceae bacterium]